MVKKAAVVGAGISGLYACLLLEQHGFSVDLYERSDSIGGRMKTEKQSGFILDHGFHVPVSYTHLTLPTKLEV